MSLARSGRLPAVAGILAPWLSPPFTTLRERVRAPYRETPANAGTHRTQLELQDCWARWLAWVLEGGAGRQLANAREATTGGTRCGGLALSVVSRGCAVAVAWTILPATAKPPWQPEWLARLKHFRGLVPADWRVVVADRGLEATWRFPVDW